MAEKIDFGVIVVELLDVALAVGHRHPCLDRCIRARGRPGKSIPPLALVSVRGRVIEAAVWPDHRPPWVRHVGWIDTDMMDFRDADGRDRHLGQRHWNRLVDRGRAARRPRRDLP